MDRRTLINTYRLGFAVLTIAAIAAQAADLHARGVFVTQNFFSYFTIQSNVIAVAVFLIGVAWWRTAPTPIWELVRGAAVVYMVFGGALCLVVSWIGDRLGARSAPATGSAAA